VAGPRGPADEGPGLDPRTVRRAIAAGEIPARRVGTKLLIPVTWLREQVAGSAPESASASLDVDQLADSVADRVIARLACAFGGMTSDVITAGPAPPGPAATADDPLPATERSRVHGTPAA